MARKRARKRTNFLDRYRLDDRMLRRGDRRIGRPALISGEDQESGQHVVIKEWRRDPKVIDEDLREIWRQEIRQLHRLAGYPGAREHIVMLHDSAEDADGFYLVLSPGQRSPLQALLDGSRSPSWLVHPRLERNRLRLWQNLQRIAIGLNILHTQGLLHRNLDAWAIFTGGGDQADFQLSGFEWSVRLTAAADRLPRHAGRGMSEAPVIHSFLQDWHAFGSMAASLLDVDAKALIANRRREGARDPALHLLHAERDLLLVLLRADSLIRLDGEVVGQRIESILAILGSMVAHREAKLYFTCGLGPQTRLSQAIRVASARTIDVGDVDRQFDFIRDDLAENSLLLAMTDEAAASGRRYVLVGRTLTYRLAAYQPRNRSEPTWDLAYCDQVAPQRPAQTAIIGQRDLSGTPIELLSLRDAKRRVPALQGKTARWDRQIRDIPLYEDGDEGAVRQYRALVLVQLLLALLIAADIWPVTVVRKRTAESRVVISVKPRANEEREKLSKALGLSSPAARMRQAFATDQTAVDGDWKLTEVGVLGERDYETARWQFVEIEGEDGAEPLYIFEGSGSPPVGDTFFLREGDYVGHDSLLRRQIKALQALRDHTELLAMLADPRIAIRQTHDKLDDDEALRALDDSKRDALREMWSVLPVYLVQGPPGVGKTRLVRELVARRFREDTTTRLLLTAQSHHSVDHLLDEVRKALGEPGSDAPLCIRCRPKGQHDHVGPFDLREQARTIVDRLTTSRLVTNAPSELQTKVIDLKAKFRQTNDEEDGASAPKRHPDRAFEALLLRSANMVFATTNASDLERLIEERAQFDWTIVEEAGKATGVELVSPLLLSHRRLMIGDHKQLPPFGAEELKKLLSDPAKVQDALEFGRPLVSRPFRTAGMENVVDDIGSNEALTTICGEAAAALMLFETMVEAELYGSHNVAPRLAIAKRLSHQHRMHPTIARLVSSAFYDGTLLTDGDCERRYCEESAPFTIVDHDLLPASPIVFVDMPYVQSTLGKNMIEQKPRYHNPDEVETVMDVLSLLQAETTAKDKPTLAVLAPYREQVRRLRDRIKDEGGGRLAHLTGFAVEGEDDTPVGTVDSFQGSEADVVVISLVRNNHHTGKRALGFLSDPRRMNVLLSRAKWKLVLVGSLEFLEKRFQSETPISTTDPLAFLRKILDTLSAMGGEVDENGVPLATVVPAGDLAGAR